MKILLTCAAGMSTSLMVEKMKKAAAERGLDATIKAESVDKFVDLVTEYDVVLLGPQVRYKLAEFKKIGAENNVPVEVIDSVAYGMVNGGKVLDQAIELIG
ncbi:PTS system cellobiose-specific IIB component [Orenia metallireducens]|jgi:PTS system cellobiose-specific IIB component|uniref:PTS system, cellobiose-specific IIB component n=1 Tax=Orenia metallireducens TaxID=1413210 RepID=A0A285GC82_9FIRM|nr:PTS sugar transporter subunit IIB [Orenia metallireducens]PRX32464.1 PTS system cellobiose-specific IIB component [Orenia metallireducens]SNY21192.1 PTS system, cellobiose-specific IIB component [Orenia metallireducens]